MSALPVHSFCKLVIEIGIVVKLKLILQNVSDLCLEEFVLYCKL